jgi:hypothetical protein
MMAIDLFEQKFREWTEGKDAVQARINIYRQIRDIPYGVIPELNHPEKYIEILNLRMGSCTPKHFLLGNMFQRLGLLVIYAAYPFRWYEDTIEYPPDLKRLARELPVSHHLACRVEINGRFILIDATLDPPLKKLGLPVNEDWDGFSDTILPMTPCGEEELYHPSEALLIQPQYDETALAFYRKLNAYFQSARQPQP